jgi:hypothetical protein
LRQKCFNFGISHENLAQVPENKNNRLIPHPLCSFTFCEGYLEWYALKFQKHNLVVFDKLLYYASKPIQRLFRILGNFRPNFASPPVTVPLLQCESSRRCNLFFMRFLLSLENYVRYKKKSYTFFESFIVIGGGNFHLSLSFSYFFCEKKGWTKVTDYFKIIGLILCIFIWSNVLLNIRPFYSKYPFNETFSKIMFF